MYINKDKLNTLIDLYSEIRISKEYGLFRKNKVIKALIKKECGSLHVDESWEVVEEFCRRHVDSKGIKMPKFSKPYIHKDEIEPYMAALSQNILMAETRNHMSYLALVVFSSSFSIILSFSLTNDPKEVFALFFILCFSGFFLQSKWHLELKLKIQHEVISLLKHIDYILNK